MLKTERQTTMSDFVKTVSLDIDAYKILTNIKRKLIKKHKRNFTYSDVVRELKKK